MPCIYVSDRFVVCNSNERIASLEHEVELLRSSQSTATDSKEIRRIAFEDAGRQYEVFQEKHRAATTDLIIKSEEERDQLNSEIQSLGAVIMSRDKIHYSS